MPGRDPSTPPDLEALRLRGMTGVDVTLQIAGPGSRSYAFIIDWHIRFLIAIAWLFLGLLIVGGGLKFKPGTGLWLRVLTIAPPIVFYLLYHLVVELVMRGQTPGKRMAGVRVVNRDGATPGVGAILIRNAFRLVDSLPMFYALGLMCVLFTRQRIRIGDMAAGTLLVVNDPGSHRDISLLAGQGAHGISPAALDLVEQLIERWNQLEEAHRGGLARSLLQRVGGEAPEALVALADADLLSRLTALRDGK